ncbi:hypothetical protein C8R46DRAFT_184568 [Mycena filopes]|nr:hypothetical protein C8R46DRAFT_184568 [Mycena filopes]
MEVPNSNSFHAPELLLLVFESVPGTSGLQACSLVSRSWVDAAQFYLFQDVDLTRSAGRWDGFRRILEGSPHLVQPIRRIVMKPPSVEALSEICSLPFSRLEDVDIALELPLDRAASAVQQLLALPTIRQVKLSTIFLDSPATFQHIWERTSPLARLRRLELTTYPGNHDDLPISNPPPHIRLESLRFMSDEEDPRWIAAILSPFDLSGLVALSIGDPQLLQQIPFFGSLPTLELLDFSVASNHHQPIDLALLPQLEVLRITILGFGEAGHFMTLRTLASIGPASRIRDIGIRLWRGEDRDLTLCADLDVALSRLPLAHPYTVTFQMSRSDYQKERSYFPRLRFSNKLRQGDPDLDWFEE